MHYSTLLLAAIAATLGAATPSPITSSNPHHFLSAREKKYDGYAVLLKKTNEDGVDECLLAFKSEELKCHDRPVRIGLYNKETRSCEKDGDLEPTRALICGEYVASLYYEAHEVDGRQSQPGELTIRKYGDLHDTFTIELGTRLLCSAGWNVADKKWDGYCLANSTKSD